MFILFPRRQVKCEQYWPDEGEGEKEYGKLSVTLLKQDIWTDNALRKFSVAKVRISPSSLQIYR